MSAMRSTTSGISYALELPQSVEVKAPEASQLLDFKSLADFLILSDSIYPELLRKESIRTEYVKRMEYQSFERVALRCFEFYKEKCDQEPIKSSLAQLIKTFVQVRDQDALKDSSLATKAKKYQGIAVEVKKLLSLRDASFVKQRDVVLKMLEDDLPVEFKESRASLAGKVLHGDKYLKDKIVALSWGRKDIVSLFKEGKLQDPDYPAYLETERQRQTYPFRALNPVYTTDLTFARNLREFVSEDEFPFLLLKPYLDTNKASMLDPAEHRGVSSVEFYLKKIAHSCKLKQKGFDVKPEDFKLVVDLWQNQADLFVEIAELKDKLELLSLITFPDYTAFYELHISIFSSKESLNNTNMLMAARILGLCLYIHEVQPALSHSGQNLYFHSLKDGSTDRELQALKESVESYEVQNKNYHWDACASQYRAS